VQKLVKSWRDSVARGIKRRIVFWPRVVKSRLCTTDDYKWTYYNSPKRSPASKALTALLCQPGYSLHAREHEHEDRRREQGRHRGLVES
jgi:hypothetical protein